MTCAIASKSGKSTAKNTGKTPDSRFAAMVERAHTVARANVSHLRPPGKVMGIDLALRKIGIAVLTDEGLLLRAFTIEHKMKRAKGEEITEAHRIHRLLAVTSEIIRHVDAFRIRYVAIENFAYNQAHQAHQMGEMAGALKTQLWLGQRIVPMCEPVTTARKHVFGNGGIKKENVLEILRNHIYLSIETDHEADAYVVARHVYDGLVI